MSPPTPAYHYSNSMGRIFLLALEEVVGRHGIKAALDSASLSSLVDAYPAPEPTLGFSFGTVSSLHKVLEQLYGPEGGRGLALRAGRASFAYVHKEFGSQMGMLDASFRLMPLSSRLITAARLLAGLFNENTDQRVRLEEQGGSILWHIERCPFCWERKGNEVVCHFMTGFLQEAFYTVSGGKIYNVVELACIAQGKPACTIQINCNPVA